MPDESPQTRPMNFVCVVPNCNATFAGKEGDTPVCAGTHPGGIWHEPKEMVPDRPVNESQSLKERVTAALSDLLTPYLRELDLRQPLAERMARAVLSELYPCRACHGEGTLPASASVTDTEWCDRCRGTGFELYRDEGDERRLARAAEALHERWFEAHDDLDAPATTWEDLASATLAAVDDVPRPDPLRPAGDINFPRDEGDEGPTVTDEEVEDEAGPEQVPGHHAAARRLLAHDRSIYRAFDSLGLGFDHAQAMDYMQGTPTFNQVTTVDAKHLPCPRPDAALAARVAGMVMAFSITAVEADRVRRG